MRYPFMADDYRKCPYCWKSNVFPINKFGDKANNLFYPIYKFKCPDCGREFKIKWIKDKEGNLNPTCCGEDEIENVKDIMVSFSKQQRRKI